MKIWKRLLVILNILLLPVVGILSNVLAAHFPELPPLILWGGGGGFILFFSALSIAIVLFEEKSEELKAVPQKKQEIKPGSRTEQTPRKILSTESNQIIQKNPELVKSINPVAPLTSSLGSGQPSVDKPMLLCLAIDVSRSMRKSIIDHTGKAIQRWATVKDAIEEFVYLGTACVKDPRTQRILPLYNLMAYGFGFREVMFSAGMRKAPGGPVRDLLAHPLLPSLPSASDLSENWPSYKERLLSLVEYTGDLFGTTPLCQALKVIRDRIKEEVKQKNFTKPFLLLIISDGLADDGDPLPIIAELQSLGVLILCCYLADKDILAPRQLYSVEDSSWNDGAKLLFHCASVLDKGTYVSHAIFDYLDDHGWKPHEGVHLFGQVNQTEALGNFLEVLLKPATIERSV
jgi:hypothetical protein